MPSSFNFAPQQYNATQMIEEHAARMKAQPYRSYEDALLGDAIESHRAERVSRLTLQQIQDSQKETVEEQKTNWRGCTVRNLAYAAALSTLVGCAAAFMYQYMTAADAAAAAYNNNMTTIAQNVGSAVAGAFTAASTYSSNLQQAERESLNHKAERLRLLADRIADDYKSAQQRKERNMQNEQSVRSIREQAIMNMMKAAS